MGFFKSFFSGKQEKPETEKQKNKEKEDPGKQYGREMKKG